MAATPSPNSTTPQDATRTGVVRTGMTATRRGHPGRMSDPSMPQPPMPAIPTPSDVRVAYREGLGPRERAALWSWTGFTATFASVRAITYTIRRGTGPFHNVSIGGAHLHHYLWGIGLLVGVGAVGVRGTDEARHHPLIALAYGAGVALIVDEFALLLDLKDVYWAREGRVSVDLGVGLVAAGGTTFSAIPLLRRLHANRRRRGR
ncbi:MAG: hypothetical protein QOH17_4878 [Pseudonocardiales bacterium]|nr:hypothetical protein [Pseudonocardiales bacterium]